MMGRMPAAKQIRIPDVQRYLTWRRLLKRHPYGIMTPAEAGRLLGLSGQAVHSHLSMHRWPVVYLDRPGGRPYGWVQDVLYRLEDSQVLDYLQITPNPQEPKGFSDSITFNVP